MVIPDRNVDGGEIQSFCLKLGKGGFYVSCLLTNCFIKHQNSNFYKCLKLPSARYKLKLSPANHVTLTYFSLVRLYFNSLGSLTDTDNSNSTQDHPNAIPPE